jgi:hypothetical protein
MNNEQELIRLGFRFGISGPHSARSMMIEELKTLLLGRPKEAMLDDYRQDIEIFNVLHKPTENARKYTFQPIATLYGLSPDIPLFKIFRQWWELSSESQPMLALQLATARDPILRSSAKAILPLHLGERLNREQVEDFLKQEMPDKYSAASLKSIAQNINGTWTQSGYLEGRSKKHRIQPKATYVNIAYALFLAHCHGLSGQRMFESFWCQMLSQDKEHLFELAHRASLRGLINFKQISEVIEVTFPNIELPKVVPSKEQG